jgi:hypothetical protein
MLTASQGVTACVPIEQILLANIPGATSVRKAASFDDRNGTHWWVHYSEYELSVDAKIRNKDFRKSNGWFDIAIETWSVIERQVIGWSRNSAKRTDYILWFWTPTGRWCLVPFRMLCAVTVESWRQWEATYRTERQYTPDKQYRSQCVFVPREILWRAMYDRFDSLSIQPAASTKSPPSHISLQKWWKLSQSEREDLERARGAA